MQLPWVIPYLAYKTVGLSGVNVTNQPVKLFVVVAAPFLDARRHIPNGLDYIGSCQPA